MQQSPGECCQKVEVFQVAMEADGKALVVASLVKPKAYPKLPTEAGQHLAPQGHTPFEAMAVPFDVDYLERISVVLEVQLHVEPQRRCQDQILRLIGMQCLRLMSRQQLAVQMRRCHSCHRCQFQPPIVMQHQNVKVHLLLPRLRQGCLTLNLHLKPTSLQLLA